VNEQEVRAILAAAMAYDNRKPGAANLLAWMEAANRGRWTFTDALEAVHDHYAKSPDFLMPAHVTAFIRAKTRQPAPAAEAIAQLGPAQPASEETRRHWTALIGEKFAMPSRLRDRKGRQRERRAPRGSADHVAAREQARRELDAIRGEAPDPPEDAA
jgi:hypothetical protein